MKHPRLAKKTELFLGLDCSTQGVKAALLGGDLALLAEQSVNFDQDLPEFRTRGGVHVAADGRTVTSPVEMWIAGLDLLFERMRAAHWPLRRVAAVSGSGQQHGSVWMKPVARKALRALNPARTLRRQLAGCFSLADSPIWMDSSTTRECRTLERAMCTPQLVADITGSRAYERFTGNQIAKIARKRPSVYRATDRIALVSSFAASILTGGYAPIDVSDGSGMNLMDIRTRDWAPKLLDLTARDLSARLGAPALSHTVCGALHPYFVRRYGFAPSCRVVVFSGDNPCSLAGLRLQEPGDVAISLGTSDTMFGSTTAAHPSGEEGHVFVNPVDPAAFMVMLVRKNGSLTREAVRDRVAGGSWETFGRMLQRGKPGNGGRIACFFDQPEITPPVMRTGVFRHDAKGRRVAHFSPAEEVRALVEGQFLSFRLHAGRVGLAPVRILATGGASANKRILQVMADVFGTAVYAADATASAALGAAYRALHGLLCERAGYFVPFAEALAGAPPFRKVAGPDRAATAVYTGMLDSFAALEAGLA